jgi:stalled ribosome rescue protein Dom34
MRHCHTIVWLDHFKAIVMHVRSEDSQTIHINSSREHRQIHRKSGEPGPGHADDDVAFFGEIAAAIAESEWILVTGPGLAKSSFVEYVERRHPDIARRVKAVETLDHPTEPQLRQHALASFKRLQQLGVA